MTQELSVQTERVDDIPVLIAQMNKLGLGELIDKHCPVHGNWQGLPLGQVVSGWLTHILSRGDHRLNRVQGWAAQRLHTLQQCLAPTVVALDFSDDRLAAALNYLGQAEVWQALERAVNQRTIRVYDLQPGRVRLDSTSVSGHWQVSPEGLFQFGPSKDHRPDLPQVKVMLAALDPLGLPLVTQVVSGQRADDPLYRPAIAEVRASFPQRKLTYIGDVKMGAQETRADLVAGGDYYLCPLSQSQVSPEELEQYLAPVWTQAQALEAVYQDPEAEQRTLIAEGFVKTVPMCVALATQTVRWRERRLIVRSVAQARVQTAALEQRLAKAEAALATYNVAKQGKKRYRELPPVQEKVATLLARYRVTDLLDVQCYVGEYHTPKGRVKPMVKVRVTRKPTAIAQAKARLGWRVYATNHTAQQLSLPQAVAAYRNEYRVEHDFARLKGRPLTIRPLYLADARRVTGLIHLLSLGLRVLTTLEFGVRQHLATQQAPLAGLYKGNPARATTRPTAERLLEAFDNITLSCVTLGTHVFYHLTALSSLQQRILTLLDLPDDPYQALLAGLPNPP